MFRTQIEKIKDSVGIHYSSNIVSLGSCFATNIGKKLIEGKFNTSINPLGISFNPLSLFELLTKATLEDFDVSEYYTKRDGLYYNFKLHSDFRFSSVEQFELQKDKAFNLLKKSVKKSSLIILTFGTAWVYETEATNDLVSNCHKRPAKEFNKRLLTVEEIISQFFEMKEYLEQLNAHVKFLVTVSPVRHTKHTLEGNAISKSILRTASYYLSEMSKAVHYYPAYEIMLDDLRDYRFYEADMIHPNTQGLQYIWDHFRKSHFTRETEDLYQTWTKISRSLQHKPFNPHSDSHQEFLKKTLKEIEQIKNKIDLKNEIKKLQKQLA